MGDKSDEKSNGRTDSDSKSKSSCYPQEKSTEGPDKMADPIKNIEAAKSSRPTDLPTSSSSTGNIGSLLSVAEKTIRDLYETISKKISNFMANDLKQLKTLSKDELTKLNASLFEYKNEMEKLSQQKIKRIVEMRNKLRERIITAEEVQSFVKYMDARMTTIKGITDNVINTLRKNEAADNFVKDLQDVVANYRKKITIAMIELYNALKEKAGTLSQSVMDKEKLATKIQKMPSTLDLQRMPSILRKIFKRMGTAPTRSFNESVTTAKKSLLPVARLREKFPTLNLSKHFNSETMYGRANVAKATYAGILLYFLYWKMKKARS